MWLHGQTYYDLLREYQYEYNSLMFNLQNAMQPNTRDDVENIEQLSQEVDLTISRAINQHNENISAQEDLLLQINGTPLRFNGVQQQPITASTNEPDSLASFTLEDFVRVLENLSPRVTDEEGSEQVSAVEPDTSVSQPQSLSPSMETTPYEFDQSEMLALEAMLAANSESIEPDLEVKDEEELVEPSADYLEYLSSRGWPTEEVPLDSVRPHLHQALKKLVEDVKHANLTYVPEYSLFYNLFTKTSIEHSYYFTDSKANLISYLIWFMEAAECFYPNRWDIIAGNDSNLILVIYEPSLEITDTASKSHTMREVYEMLTITNYFSIKCARTIITEDECRAGYLFSHCSSMSQIKEDLYMADCCLGSSELSIMQTEMNSAALVSKDRIFLLLAQLYQYFTYENSGNPYKHLALIGAATRYKQQDVISRIHLATILKKRLKSETGCIPGLSIEKVRDDEYKLTLPKTMCKSAKFIKYIEELERTPKCYFNIDTGDYVNDLSAINNSNSKPTSIYVGKTILTFRGEPKEFIIIPNERKEVSADAFEITVHPSVVLQYWLNINSILNC